MRTSNKITSAVFAIAIAAGGTVGAGIAFAEPKAPASSTQEAQTKVQGAQLENGYLGSGPLGGYILESATAASGKLDSALTHLTAKNMIVDNKYNPDILDAYSLGQANHVDEFGNAFPGGEVDGGNSSSMKNAYAELWNKEDVKGSVQKFYEHSLAANPTMKGDPDKSAQVMQGAQLWAGWFLAADKDSDILKKYETASKNGPLIANVSEFRQKYTNNNPVEATLEKELGPIKDQIKAYAPIAKALFDAQAEVRKVSDELYRTVVKLPEDKVEQIIKINKSQSNGEELRFVAPEVPNLAFAQTVDLYKIINGENQLDKVKEEKAESSTK